MKKRSEARQLMRRAKKWAVRSMWKKEWEEDSAIVPTGIVATIATVIASFGLWLIFNNPLATIVITAGCLSTFLLLMPKLFDRATVKKMAKKKYPGPIVMVQAYLRHTLSKAKDEALGESSKLNILLAEAEKRRAEAGKNVDEINGHLKKSGLDANLRRELVAALAVAKDALLTFREAVEKLTKHRARLSEFFARAEAMLAASGDTPYAAMEKAYRLGSAAREMEVSVEEMIVGSLANILARVGPVQEGLVEMYREAV